MRTDYQRSAGFGTSKASINAGKRYEQKVTSKLHALFPDSPRLGFSLREQYPINGGYVDAAFVYHGFPLLLVEVKSQWSLDAYKQLISYAGEERSSLSYICICKIYHPHVSIPEPATCLMLDHLLLAPKGKLTIIPWSPPRR